MPRLIELSYYSSLHCFQFSLKLIGKRRAMNIAKEVSDLWVSFPLWRQIVQMSKWSLWSHSNVSQPKLYSRRAFGLTSSLNSGVTSLTRRTCPYCRCCCWPFQSWWIFVWSRTFVLVHLGSPSTNSREMQNGERHGSLRCHLKTLRRRIARHSLRYTKRLPE